MSDLDSLPSTALARSAARLDDALQQVTLSFQRAADQIEQAFQPIQEVVDRMECALAPFRDDMAHLLDHLRFEEAQRPQVKRVVARYRRKFMARSENVESIVVAERREESEVIDHALTVGVSIAVAKLQTGIWDEEPWDAARRLLLETVRTEANHELYENARALRLTRAERRRRAEVDLDSQPAAPEPDRTEADANDPRIAALRKVASPRERMLLDMLLADPDATSVELAAGLNVKPSTVRVMEHNLKRRAKGL